MRQHLQLKVTFPVELDDEKINVLLNGMPVGLLMTGAAPDEKPETCLLFAPPEQERTAAQLLIYLSDLVDQAQHLTSGALDVPFSVTIEHASPETAAFVERLVRGRLH